MPALAHRHAEAFKLMAYRCDLCATSEIIWNSRDGVTPFCVACAACGMGEANHVDWALDVYAPDHRLLKGQRYFRDGLREEARAIMRRRLELGRGTAYAIPEEDWPAFIDRAVEGHAIEVDGERVPMGEFQPGWPMLVVAGTDADTLSVPEDEA